MAYLYEHIGQQLPSTGSPYAKPIKDLVRAPKGWLFVGADYIGLESIIAALKTRDPNKLSPYLEGYDDHCLRAYTYWKNKMPDIRQAESGERCYLAKVGNEDIYFKDSDMIEYENQTFTGDEFYEAFTSGRL